MFSAFSFVETEPSGIKYEHHNYKLTDIEYLKQYKEVLTLFKYIGFNTALKEHVDIAKEYSIEKNLNEYTNLEAVKNFLQLYEQGILPKNEIFSIFNDDHLEQAISLYKVLYYANDFRIFYKTAVWAQYYLNQGMFLYCYSVAIIHRFDTYSMVLPPIYEIYPAYFFNSDSIEKAQSYKIEILHGGSKLKSYTFQSNYSEKQPLSYFSEDVGINAYYYYYNLYRPFWMSSKEYDINSYYRGEEFYYLHQQLLARLYLEYLSCHHDEQANFYFGNVDGIAMFHPCGLHLVTVSQGSQNTIENCNSIQNIMVTNKYEEALYIYMDYERRISDAVDSRTIITEGGGQIPLCEPSGFNTLGNIIEGNAHSPNKHFYGYLQTVARQVLGRSLDTSKLAPSELEHFETSLRHPAFWRFLKKMIFYLQKYKKHLPKYTYSDLEFPGVEVEEIQISELVTYFAKFVVDLTNAAYSTENQWKLSSFELNADQYRLNHEPFTYNIKVKSEKDDQAVVRVFIGPKFDEYGHSIDLNDNRLNFVEFDRFKYDLKRGEHLITRSSDEIFYASDKVSFRKLYENVLQAINGTGPFTTHGSEVYYAFPNRMLLPKGNKVGKHYQLYVILSKYTAPPKLPEEKQEHQQVVQDLYEKLHEGYEYEFFKHPIVGLGIQYLDGRPLGFPFDRPINKHSFKVPNSHFHEVVIHHR